MIARNLRGTGTPEASWRASGRLERLPRVDVDELAGPAGCALLAVAPHPDDEVLGAGGLLASAAATGREVTVLALTGGEGSHPGSPTLDPGELVARRRLERADALRVLGLDPARVRELGLPDGGVADHESAVVDAVAAAVDDLTRAGVAPVCVAPRPGDGHPDHDAAARAVATACRDGQARTVGYGVWFWHSNDPADAALDDVPPGGPAGAPAGDLDDRPAEDVVEVTEDAPAEPTPEEQPALDLGVPDGEPAEKPRRSRKGRASVPSWDEIMFGGGSAGSTTSDEDRPARD